jgi:hypothetical protein
MCFQSLAKCIVEIVPIELGFEIQSIANHGLVEGALRDR